MDLDNDNSVHDREESDDEPAFNAENLDEGFSGTYDAMCFRTRAGCKMSRVYLEAYIKKLFRDNSGLALSTNPLMPINLEELEIDKLINLADNIISQVNRSKKSMMIDRTVGTITNVAQLACTAVGVTGSERIFQEISKDSLLRDSAVQIFFGKNASPSPMVSFGISIAHNLTTVLVTLIQNGQLSEYLARWRGREHEALEGGGRGGEPRNN